MCLPAKQLINTQLIETRVSGTFKLYWQPHVRLAEKQPYRSAGAGPGD